jgi:uncharacterized membrane protein YfcA
MWHWTAYIAMGLVAGFASALLGVGGGVVMVPTLIMIFAVPAKTATATSLAYIVPIALYGTLKQWYGGQDVRWLLALAAVPLGLVGAELGVRAKQHLSNAHLQIIFAVFLILIGLHLGRQGWADLKGRPPVAAQTVNGPTP